MFFRKSGLINPHCKANNSCSLINSYFMERPTEESQKQFQKELQQQEFRQQRYFNCPKIVELAQESREKESSPEDRVNDIKEELDERNVSATTKALWQMDSDDADKKKWKKGARSSTAWKKKKFNQRLSKLLMPKSALLLLHELKPACNYNIQEQLGSVPPHFSAEVTLHGEILGTGQGSSKSQAKTTAAENAIKNIVSKAMSRYSETKEGEGKAESNQDDEDDTPENLPWAGLASFAIYKMFNEWQSGGTDIPQIQVIKKKTKPFINAPMKKNLPPNAVDLHPAVVLNMVHPGLTAIELERSDVPKCRVKMAYIVEGKTFSGVGGNKKDAKREAAKAVLEGMYGLNYP